MTDCGWKQKVPSPTLDGSADLIDLYWKAWELAHDHIREDKGLPQSPYLDEAHWEDTIWIWDTCFMALFSKYAPAVFPGVESLNNFYVPLHTDRYPPGAFPQNIQHPDNPPLFAWVEHDHFLFTNDSDHISDLLNETQYLQKHFEWFDHIPLDYRFESQAATHNPSAPIALQRKPNGYLWGGIQSGMDNTPRNGDGLWIDAIAQQGLSALYISRLFERIGNAQAATEWKARYDGIKATVNEHYWDDEDGIYYDIDPDSGDFLRVKTPACFWPMLAEMCSPEQAAALVKHLQDPKTFGGERPWVSVARNDPAFVAAHGDYWRGGIWLPLAYMGTKALEKYGYYDEAASAADALLMQMVNAYKKCDPHTIWECYSPTSDEPASYKAGKGRVRPDFCGWSALGPISMLIETILGFHTVDASSHTVKWYLHQRRRHGITNLHFGKVVTDIHFDGCNTVSVTSNTPYTIAINGKDYEILSGTNTITLNIEQVPAGDVLKAAPEK